jgi:hypothetical protein
MKAALICGVVAQLAFFYQAIAASEVQKAIIFSHVVTV